MATVEGWNLGTSMLSDDEMTALRDLAHQWVGMSPDARAGTVAALQAQYPDLELSSDDVTQLMAKFNETDDL
jgi:hypothetical protein